jgi:hypothetical protein
MEAVGADNHSFDRFIYSCAARRSHPGPVEIQILREAGVSRRCKRNRLDVAGLKGSNRLLKVSPISN